MKAHNRRRFGFTIAELLVVVTIIGMLAALLTPAIMRAVEQARRAACTNLLAELTKATVAYDLKKGRLPGMINPPAGAQGLSWPVHLLPELGRGDLWNNYRKGVAQANIVQIQQFICPSDVDAPIRNPVGALTYVANWNLFRDRSAGDAKNDVSITVVKATAATPLFSERLGGPPGAAALTGPWAPLPTQDKLAFVWPGSGTIESLGTVVSSNHRGGVNVAFCDGRVEFILNSADASVYSAGPARP